MASHKVLQHVGLKALCDQIKELKTTVGQLSTAVVQVSDALESLSSELEELVNGTEAEIEDLTVAIIDGEVSASLVTQSGEGLTTRSGVEIHAIRNL